MSGQPLWTVFLNACLVNNFVLAYFLGICPFLGVSGRVATAVRMGGAVTFVMLITSLFVTGINALLTAIEAPYLALISYIAVIASAVQLVEMFIKKTSPVLFRALGIFLPLITTNCVVLGRAEAFASRNPVALSAFEGLLMGLGFTAVLVVLGALRELLGNGTLFADMQLLFGPAAADWVIRPFGETRHFLLAVLPPGAFLFTGLLIALKNAIDAGLKARAEAARAPAAPAGSKRVRVTGHVG